MTPIEHAKDIAFDNGLRLLKKHCEGIVPDVAIVLGTGWGKSLAFQKLSQVSLTELPGFPAESLLEIPGHARTVVCGELAGKRVIALNGRVHLNEHSTDPQIPRMVRLQIQMLLEMGVRKFILTNAVGSLKHECRVGDLVIVDGFVTLYAPPMPLFAGEFCSPEDRLDRRLRALAADTKVLEDGKILLTHQGGYAMVRGPFFEGRKYDKHILRSSGAMAVGMSVLPEMCVIALYEGASALCLSFVTNTDIEEHSHESNQARAKESSTLLGAYLKKIIEQI